MKYLDILANKCGLSEGENFEALASYKNETPFFGTGASSIAKHIAFRVFDNKAGIFYNEDGWQGFALEIEPIVGLNDVIAKNLEHFFAEDLPVDSFVQFQILASHKIGPVLDIWEAERKADITLLKKIAEKRKEFYRGLALEGNEISPRNFRIIISVSSKNGSSSTILTFKQILLRRLSTLNLHPREIDAHDVLSLCEEMIRIDEDIYVERKSTSSYAPLNEQIFLKGEEFHVTEKQLNVGNVATRAYRVEEFPESFSMANMIGLFGEFSKANIPLLGRVAVSLVIANNLKEGNLARINARGENVKKSSEQSYARHNISLQKEATEWIFLLNEIRNNKKLLSYSLSVSLSAKADFIDEAEANLVTLYNLHRWKIKRADKVHLLLLIATLPMHSGYYWDRLQFFKMTRLGTNSECTAFLPICGEWKGMRKSGILYFGRCGQLFNFNPFFKIASGNFNLTLIAPAGSGKSFTGQALIEVLLAQNVKVFVLDIGLSYQNLCRAVGGELISFSRDSDICLNPFAANCEQMSDDVKQDIIIYSKSIISSMCKTDGAALEESLIQRAISEVLDEFGVETNISKIAQALKKFEVAGERLSSILYPYTDAGIYGKFFNQESNISFKNNMVVFEFENIKNDTNFLAVVLQIVAMQIFMQVLTSSRSQNFVIVVDEAWKILDTCSGFLAELARTLRKYGGSLVTCVQSYNDFQSSSQSKIIFENSAWTILLKQDEKNLAAFRESPAFGDLVPLIRSLSFVPGKYAECLIYSSGLAVVGRLVLDPYSSALYSTDAADFDFINNSKEAATQDIDVVIERLVQRKKNR